MSYFDHFTIGDHLTVRTIQPIQVIYGRLVSELADSNLMLSILKGFMDAQERGHKVQCLS